MRKRPRPNGKKLEDEGNARLERRMKRKQQQKCPRCVPCNKAPTLPGALPLPMANPPLTHRPRCHPALPADEAGDVPPQATFAVKDLMSADVVPCMWAFDL